MRSRSILSALAFLLLIGSYASAAALAPAEAQKAAVEAPAAPAAAPAEPSPFCAAKLSALKPPAFGTTPAPTPLLFNVCGACSETVCQGAHIGNACGGYGYSCQNVYGDRCTDGNSECYCWKGPLP
jgi:hypothetical protein